MNEFLSSAVISDDQRYRYHLCRWWAPGPRMVFVMLNPSTADATKNDPTIMRCIGFARREGLAGVDVINLYAYRTAKPAVLWAAEKAGEDIVGRSNDSFLRELARQAAEVGAPLVAAWGANAKPDRVARVLSLPFFERMQCLGLTQDRMPRHPLYLPVDAPLTSYEAAA